MNVKSVHHTETISVLSKGETANDKSHLNNLMSCQNCTLIAFTTFATDVKYLFHNKCCVASEVTQKERLNVKAKKQNLVLNGGK